jgi:HlyD family secretion protein
MLMLQACNPVYNEVVSLGTLERDRIELTAESREPITRVYVQEGDLVEANMVLLQQDTRRAEVALLRAKADEASARSALFEAEAGPRQQQVTGARARLEAAISSLRTLKIELDRALSLAERKLASQNNVDLLQGRYNEAQARVQESAAGLDELLEGTRSEKIEQARSRHAASLAVVQDLEISLDRTATRAPVTGLVEALPFEIGERPNPGATVIVLLASGRTYARIHLSEPLRAQLKTGSPAEVWLDGRSEPLPGKVRWIASSAAFTPYFALNQHDRSRLSYMAEVDITHEEAGLPIGIPVEVVFPELNN